MSKKEKKRDRKKKELKEKNAPRSNNKLKENIKRSVKYDKIVLILLALILLSSVFLLRFHFGNPLLYQAESYNHLSNVNSYLNQDIHFWELNPLEMCVYLFSLIISISTIQGYIFMLSPLLALGSILLFLKFSDNLKFDKFKTFLFTFVLILTPAFILNFTILSNYAVIIFLACLGLCLLSSKNKLLKYLSIIPLCIISLFEGLSTFMILAALISYYFHSSLFPIIRDKLKNFNLENNVKTKKNKEKDTFGNKFVNELIAFKVSKLVIFILFILLFINKLFFEISWVSETFNSNLFFSNLVSDLGAFSGLSIFVLFLAIFGLFTSWKDKGSIVIYLSLFVSFVSYYLNNNAVIFISIILAYFASDFIRWVIDRKWSLNEAKNFTLLLIFLGLLFSSISYVERLSDYSPYQEKLEMISWLEENYYNGDVGNVVLLSSPENSQYVSALSNFDTFPGISSLESLDPELWYRVNTQLERDSYIEGKEVFSLTYPSVLFPLLEEYNVGYIYVDPQLRTEFEGKRGLLFALRNERFKLIHSHEQHEIWEFNDQ